MPLLNTASVTNMSYMFSGCDTLTSVPLLNTASVTNMSNMFSSCYALTSVPLFNTVGVTDMSYMFSSCYALTSVPAMSASAATGSASYTSMFSSCSQLARIYMTGFKYTFSVASCKLSAASLDALYSGLATVDRKSTRLNSSHHSISYAVFC